MDYESNDWVSSWRLSRYLTGACHDNPILAETDPVYWHPNTRLFNSPSVSYPVTTVGALCACVFVFYFIKNIERVGDEAQLDNGHGSIFTDQI